ncbi:MAG: XRE family transcriptional regulator [Lepagella sp.]
MTINERFDELIKVLYGGNKRAFAKALEVAPTVIENVVGSRQGKPSFEVISKVCALANINAEWVVCGTGEMMKTAERPNRDGSNNSPIVSQLLETIKEQAEEIGRLKERNAQLERENMDLRSVSNRNFTPQGVEQVFVEPNAVQKV